MMGIVIIEKYSLQNYSVPSPASPIHWDNSPIIVSPSLHSSHNLLSDTKVNRVIHHGRR